jgi:hypothetical protein
MPVFRPKAIIFGMAVLLTIFLLPQNGISQGKIRQAIVEKYYKQNSAKSRISIGLKLSQSDLKELITVYRTDMPGEKGSKVRTNYLMAVEMLRSALIDAKNAGATKKAEVSLRQQIRSLEQLIFTLSYEERTVFEPVLETVRQVHREALNTVMN